MNAPLNRTFIVVGLVACGATAASGCATPPKRIPPRAKATLTVQPAPPAERLTTPAALRLAATELECDQGQVSVWDKGRYIQVRGCNQLAYFVKLGPKQWERSGDIIRLAPGDELPNVDDEASMVPAKLLHSPEIKLTRKEFLGLTRWNPEVSSDCVVRANGTLGYCYTLTDEGALIDLTELSQKATTFQPATLNGAPVNSTLVVTLKVDLGDVNCEDQEKPELRARCEQNLAKLKALGTEQPMAAEAAAPSTDTAKASAADTAKAPEAAKPVEAQPSAPLMSDKPVVENPPVPPTPVLPAATAPVVPAAPPPPATVPASPAPTQKNTAATPSTPPTPKM